MSVIVFVLLVIVLHFQLFLLVPRTTGLAAVLCLLILVRLFALALSLGLTKRINYAVQ